jgi:hypothetical protein
VGGQSTYAKSGAGAGVGKDQSDWEHTATVDAALKESGVGKGRAGRAARKSLKAGDAVPTVMTDVVVLASGNLGLVSFTGPKHRVTLEEIERDYPGLVDKLAAHPGVGFVMVAASGNNAGSEGEGAQNEGVDADAEAGVETVIIGKNGLRRLSDDHIEGEDPLLVYGPNAARHLRRTTSFSNCPDLLVMSTYWPATDENAAFEELVGNHGGLGGEQTQAFVFYPAEWQLDDTELVGAESVYRNLKRWTTIATARNGN